MNPFKRTASILVAALTLGLWSAMPSAAQLGEAEQLTKQAIELAKARKYAEAVPLTQRALAIQEKTLGPDHPEVAASLNNLAQLYVLQGRYAEAEALFKRSLAIRERSLGPDNPDVAASLNNLAHLYRAQGRNTEAEPLEKRAQAQAQQKFETAAAPKVAGPRPRPAPQSDVPFISRSAPPRPYSGPAPPGGSSSSGSSAATTPNALPDFPWPPPKASTSYVLPRNIFQSRATVGDVANTIVSALERTGYVERSFFRTQADGVALVTRLERINDDGTARAGSERWPAAAQTYQSSSDLVGFFRGLFFVDRGRYRIIAFVLQDLPFVQSSGGVTGPEARAWLREGANVLPRDVANRPYGDANCSVLIYEFASDGTAVRAVESSLTGKQHLEKAGVLSYLEKAN